MRSLAFAVLFLIVVSPVALASGQQQSQGVEIPQLPGSSSTGHSLSSSGTGVVVGPPIGQHIVLKSVYGAGYFNFSGTIHVFPATLFLNMTVASSSSTGIVFSVDYGNATEGIPGLACISPVCDYRVWKIASGTAFLSFAGRLSIDASAVLTSTGNPWHLSLAGPSRLVQSSGSVQIVYDLFALLYGHISDSTTSIGLLYLVGVGAKRGDVDMDGKIDIADLATVAASYGTSYGQANYNPLADVTMHGADNIQDLATVAYNYGQSY